MVALAVQSLIVLKDPVEILFINAAPSDNLGYNQMSSREQQIETFDRFLHETNECYYPDHIYVACNTLSTLLPDCLFFRKKQHLFSKLLTLESNNYSFFS